MPRLQELKQDLAQVTAEMTKAEAAMDVDASIAARQRIEVLRGFIARLETTAQHDAESTAKADAATWIAGHEAKLADAPEALAKLQAECARRIASAVEAIEAEGTWRRSVEARATAADLLAARFGLPAPSVRPPPPIPLEDWATPVLKAVDAMRPSQHKRRTFRLLGLPASATADDRRAATLRAVHEYRAKHGAGLPSEAVAILDAAPIPAGVFPAPAVPSEQEQRDARRMAATVSETQRALGLVPGTLGGLSL